jgi:predicted permease
MRLLKSLSALFRKRKLESELNDEMRFHLEQQIAANLAAGMTLEEARRQALIEFGGVQQTREAVREVRWSSLLDKLVQDMRYAFRILRKSPAFTAVAVLTLALGIGMNTAIFSVIDAVLFRSLPVRDPQGLVVLKWEARKQPTTQGMMSFGDCNGSRDKAHPSGCSLPLPLLKEIQSQTSMFSSLAASTGFGQMDLGGNGPAKRVQGQFVSGGYFETLGVMPAAGRLLSAADDQPDAPPAAVLNYKFWQSDFGGSRSVVGKTVRLNNKPFTIVGVTEPGFTSLALASQFDLWVPLSQQKSISARWLPIQAEMGFFGYTIVGRVKPGILVSQAEAAANVVFRNATLQRDKPFFKAEDDPHLRLMAAQQELRGSYDQVLRPVYVLMLCVGIILLIACANVAGLLLARAASREREMAVRLALGAKRFRLLSQLLVESLTLSVMGGALGLLMAVWGARVLMALLFSGRQGPPTFSPHLDWRVLAFTAGLSILTGVVFGMAPAFRGLRVDLTPSLKAADTSGSAAARRRRFNMGNLLVATQVALAVLVLATAGLLVRTLNNLKSVDPGFDANNLLLFGLNPRLAGYKGPQVSHLYQDLQDNFAALPGVKSVSYSWVPLLSGGQMQTSFHRPGTPIDSKDQVDADVLEIGPNFFATLRIPMQAGRDLSAADFAAAALTSPFEPAKAPAIVVVNQSFVRTYFPSENPLGQVFGDSPAEDPWPAFPGYQIVGVVGDAKYNNLRQSINPTIYQAVSDGEAFFELRTAADPTSLIPAVRNNVNRVDSNLALVRIDTQKGQIDQQLSQDRMVAQLSSFFGLLALVLACMGLYGLLSYEVTRRTREIGIRMAIGAQAGNVIRLVIGQAVVVAAFGAVAGVAISLGVTRLLTTLLYGVKPGDPTTLLSVMALLVMVAVVACFLPARRATKVDPLVALRYE